MKPPIVSVCVVTYNHADFVDQCLQGILMQKMELEIIVIDDASTDGTAKILQHYKKKYPNRIRLVLNEINQHGKQLTNIISSFLQQEINGTYLAVCEGDDYWTDPLKLRKQVDFMEQNPDVSMCYHAVRKIFMTDGKKEVVFGIDTAENLKFDLKEFFKDKNARTVTRLMRSSCLENIPEWCFHSPIADFPLQMICALRGKIGYIGGEPMAVYRVGVKGSTNHGMFGTKEEQQLWLKKRLYNYKKSRDLFNINSHYLYDDLVQRNKERFSFRMLYKGIDMMDRKDLIKLYWEYMPAPYKVNRRRLGFWKKLLLK